MAQAENILAWHTSGTWR